MGVWKTRALATFSLLLAVALAMPGAAVAYAQADPSLVAPIVARLLAYERTLQDRAGGSVDLLIAFDEDEARSRSQAEALAGAFRALGNQTIQGLPLRIRSEAVSGRSPSIPNGVDVVVMCEGIAPGVGATLLRQAARRRVLLVALSRDALENHAAIAVVMEQGRPRIVTKLSRVQQANLQLSSRFLRLSEVL